MDNHIKELFKKYISDKANKADRKKIREAVSLMPDKELDHTLSDIWNEYDGTKEIDGFNLITNKIQPRRRITSIRIIASVAASLLICTMIGLQVYYYINNKKLNNFINQEVAMSVQSGERTDITLPDGTKMTLNAGTAISYSVDYGLVKREVKLTGEAFFDVAKNPEKPFILNTEYVGIEVLGTKFNISAYTEFNEVETTLLEGSVKLTTKGIRKQTIVMQPNDKAVYNKETDELSVTKKTAIHLETAWLEGKLVFRSADFKNILKKLEQRYGVEIIIRNPEKYNMDLFTGTFKEDYVNGVLKILQLHYNFTYTEDDGKIHITLNSK
ncbi:FecR family protein [Bacteroides sp. 519]|uniref:FecR family protein n=1 Tax=Bacteroides sp. 519 TaxID=2302937 RepID=UPI0013D79E90|nr:FecR family protein [Bacteroides sp. 519]NDV60741.1 FecR family protein [Bacteroides sp. 519]